MDNLEKIILEVDHDDGKLIEGDVNEAEKNIIDDSDEVMVVGQVISNPKETFAKCVGNENDDDDDDCVILDGDLDKPVAIENNGGNDSGDLCLVGEKGQVACRDYPHPRHLCVKFPFNSTPHEKHCDKCYCYVCDSVAPCGHWGDGVSNIDHCHATEKNAFWEAHREGAKTSHKAPPFVSEVGLTSMNQVPSLLSNPLMHNQEQPTGQPRSVTSTGTPYGIMPVRTSRGDPRNKFHPYLVLYHLQRQSVDHAGTQLIPQHVPFERPEISGGILSTRNNHGYQFSANESLGSRWQDPREMGNPVLTTYECTKANFGGVATNSVPNSSTWSPVGIEIENYAPLQPQVYPHIHSGSVNANSVVPHTQLSSQTCMSSKLGNLIPTAPTVATQQRWGSRLANPMILQPQAASQPNVYQNVVTTPEVVTSHGSINYPTGSPVNSYGETSLSLNSQSLLAGSTQPISQTSMGDNLGNLMPGTATLQRFHYLCNSNQLPSQNVYQNVVPTPWVVTSHGSINYPSESPVNSYGETSLSLNSQSLLAESTQPISHTSMGDNLGNLMPGSPTSHGSINYPTGSPVNSYGETSLSLNSQSLLAGSTQPISQTSMGDNLGNLMPGSATLQRFHYLCNSNQLPSQNVYQNAVPTQSVVTSHGSINYPSESPVNSYGETSLSLNSQSLLAESTQPISHTSMGDNLGNLMPGSPTLQRFQYLCNSNQLPSQNVCQNVVPTQSVVTSHGSINYPFESPVNSYGETSLSLNSQPLLAESTQAISQTSMGDNFGNLMPDSATLQRFHYLCNSNQLPSQNAYQNVVPTQSVLTSHGSINYPFESPVNSYGETSLSLNSQSLLAESTQPISQTSMGDNFGNLMPDSATLQRFHYLCNSNQLPGQNVYQNVVPTQSVVTSHGSINYSSESPVHSYGETSLNLNSQSLPAESTQPISQTFMGDNLRNLMPGVALTLQRFHYLSNPDQLDSQNDYQNVVTIQPQETSHGNAESPVTSMAKPQ